MKFACILEHVARNNCLKERRVVSFWSFSTLSARIKIGNEEFNDSLHCSFIKKRLHQQKTPTFVLFDFFFFFRVGKINALLKSAPSSKTTTDPFSFRAAGFSLTDSTEARCITFSASAMLCLMLISSFSRLFTSSDDLVMCR